MSKGSAGDGGVAFPFREGWSFEKESQLFSKVFDRKVRLRCANDERRSGAAA
jgi:hypothetical protein